LGGKKKELKKRGIMQVLGPFQNGTPGKRQKSSQKPSTERFKGKKRVKDRKNRLGGGRYG